jgi:hypothetical protein
MITAEVWQAVALSFGAEPMTVRGLALDCRDGEFDECPPDFRERLEIACNHIENGTLRADGAGQIPFRKVTLAEFSEWAFAPPRNWCLPKQFPRNPGRTVSPAMRAVPEPHSIPLIEAVHELRMICNTDLRSAIIKIVDMLSTGQLPPADALVDGVPANIDPRWWWAGAVEYPNSSAAFNLLVDGEPRPLAR